MNASGLLVTVGVSRNFWGMGLGLRARARALTISIAVVKTRLSKRGARKKAKPVFYQRASTSTLR